MVSNSTGSIIQDTTMRRLLFVLVALCLSLSTTELSAQKALSQSITEIATLVEYGPRKGGLNGYEWIDLGLPSGTRWATCNVDASATHLPGRLYSWGETIVKSSYTESNTPNYGRDIADFSGDKAYDVATAKWGEGWRMPTKEEFDELVYYCYWRYVQREGRWGAEFTSSVNGNSIFLPATGYKDGTKHYEASGCGSYWTSTPWQSAEYKSGAHEYHFGGALGEAGISERYYGYAIRPVTDYDVDTNVIPVSGEINGHPWVDLGLPSGTKWATQNLGANAVDQDGEHYAWGEVYPYADKHSTKNDMYDKESGDIAGDAHYDVACALWGGTWRLPTEEEFNELITNCTFEWTSIGRRYGVKITSRTNGNYIFLPASGVHESRYAESIYPTDINETACYWSSTPARSNYHHKAYGIKLNKTMIIMLSHTRFYGYSIRPVSD